MEVGIAYPKRGTDTGQREIRNPRAKLGCLCCCRGSGAWSHCLSGSVGRGGTEWGGEYHWAVDVVGEKGVALVLVEVAFLGKVVFGEEVLADG